MSGNQGQSTSAWTTAARPTTPPISADQHADVCVVGAGIAGMTTAYLLAREGLSVVLLDDGVIGGGQTERTTAHLTCALDDRFTEIERLHGETGLRLAAESHAAAIDTIERIVTTEGIDCAFARVDGYLVAPSGESSDIIDRELAAAHRSGLRDVERIARAPIAFDTGPVLRFPRQGQFHPLQYLAGLARAIVRDGGRIYSGAHVTEIGGGNPATVRVASGHTVTAGSVVVATNTPINDRFEIHTKQAPYMSYVIGLAIPTGSVERMLLWDTLDPYHYVRTHEESPTQQLLIVGGEDHKTAQADDADQRYAALERWTRERFPAAGEVRYRWSGQVMETQDGLAFIGPNPLDDENIYIATGDSGMGMTHGTIAGVLLTDLIAGRENAWASLYDPRRRAMGAVGTWIKENANVAWQYTDWLKGGEVDSIDEIAPGGGAVIRRGMAKVAVYCDEGGLRHEMSAVCPHLGCIVAWNSNEHTWDCPCHGSRFDRTGGVLNGPANTDLERLT